MDDQDKGRPIAVDKNAISASPTEPAFIARPEGAPVYYGFRILEDVCVDGFTLGIISDFESESCDCGDAFVIAPDDSRAGIVWEIGTEESFEEVLPPDPVRWGVWGVSFTHPMRNRDDARYNLATIIPQLKERWENWRANLS